MKRRYSYEVHFYDYMRVWTFLCLLTAKERALLLNDGSRPNPALYNAVDAYLLPDECVRATFEAMVARQRTRMLRAVKRLRRRQFIASTAGVRREQLSQLLGTELDNDWLSKQGSKQLKKKLLMFENY